MVSAHILGKTFLRILTCATVVILIFKPDISTSSSFRQLQLFRFQKRVDIEIVLFGHHNFHQPARIPAYLTSIISDKNTNFIGSQYEVNIRESNQNTGLDTKLFRYGILFEGISLRS